jgi:hypothetical protein
VPFTPGWNPDKQARIAREASNQGQLDGPLPLISVGGRPAVNTFDYPNPSFASVVAQNRIARTATDQGQYNPLLPELLGQDRVHADAGQVPNYEQQQAVPIGRRPGLDILTQADASEFWMLADAMVAGQQQTELPPKATARARDYSIAASFPLELIGQDATNAGIQSTDLPPRAALRARDYSFLQAVPLNLLGADAMVAGQQLSGNAPATARRAATLTEPGSNQILLLTSAPPVIPQGQGSSTSELPPRGPARARDYSIGQGFPLELVGNDQLFGAAGEVPAYDWSYLPPKPRYQQGTGEPIQDLLGTLLQVIVAALPAGAQSFDVPRAAPRARDYSWTWAVQLLLLGQDATNPGVQISGNAPAGPRRAPDYSFLASFPLELLGQDAMASGAQWTALPFPTGPARARDYTIGAAFPLELVGKDAMLVGGQYTDLAPRAAARARDYSHLATYALPNTTPQRDLSYTAGPPESKWRMGLPESRWVIRPPQE